jgi:hypothetical protein
MKNILLVSRDKKTFKMFKMSSIERIDLEKLHPNSEDDARAICIYQKESCTHAFAVADFDFDSFVSFINEDGLHNNTFIINLDEIEV